MCAGSSEARCRCTQSSLWGPAGLLENAVSAERGPWAVCARPLEAGADARSQAYGGQQDCWRTLCQLKGDHGLCLEKPVVRNPRVTSAQTADPEV